MLSLVTRIEFLDGDTFSVGDPWPVKNENDKFEYRIGWIFFRKAFEADIDGGVLTEPAFYEIWGLPSEVCGAFLGQLASGEDPITVVERLEATGSNVPAKRKSGYVHAIKSVDEEWKLFDAVEEIGERLMELKEEAETDEEEIDEESPAPPPNGQPNVAVRP